MTPIKPFHFGHQFDYALLDLVDSWMRLTALLEASASILEGEGRDVAEVRASILRGDRALVAALRRDETEERLS